MTTDHATSNVLGPPPGAFRRSKRLAGHVVAPVVLGALIYLLWRSPRLLVFDWASTVGAQPAVQAARHTVAGFAIPAVVLFSLPDALWTYALTYAVGAVWSAPRSAGRRVWLALCALAALGPEIGQALTAVPGTFDPVDLILCAGAFALAWHSTRPLAAPEPFGEHP